MFSLAGMDLVANKIISQLFNAFKKTCPSREVKPPEWDLCMVLKILTCPPCELLKLSSDKHLTLKACFLLDFILAKRVSELLGLSSLVWHSRNLKSCKFSFVLGFVRPQDPSIHDPRFEEFVIPSLEGFIDDDVDELLLCPVRALRKYLLHVEQCHSESPICSSQ